MLSIIIVAYRPDLKKLNNLIKQIDDKYKIIVINNSETNHKIPIVKKKNIKIIKSKNNGNGAAINLGIKYCKTKFVLYMDIDVEIKKSFFPNFINTANKIKKFGVLIPNHGNLKQKNKIIEKYSGEASVMLFNMNEIKKTSLFDEKYFLYFEEIDLFYQCKQNFIKVFFIKNLKIKHIRASSVLKTVKNLNNIRSWHYMWSMFHFYKKHYSYFFGLKKMFKLLVKDISMMFFNIFTLNITGFVNRFFRIYGLLTSILGLKSFLRP